VCPKWNVLQENWGTSGEKRAKSDRGVPETGCFAEKLGTSGEKRAKSDRGVPETGCFAGKLGDLGQKKGKKRPRCTPLTGIIVEKQGTKVNFFQG